MPTWTMKGGGQAGGYDFSWDTPVSGAQVTDNPLLPAGMSATTWTKSTASAGVAVMPSNHTIESEDLVDVYWADGYRYGMTATVNGTSVSLSGGGGDDLPDSDTAVLLCEQVALTLAFVGTYLDAILASATIRSLFCLLEGDGTVHPYELLPTRGLSWNSYQDLTLGVSSKTIVSGTLSTTDTVSERPVKYGILYDSTPGYPD